MKRSRDTRDAAVTPAPVNVPAEQACSAIVTHASKHWKDRCGSLFEIEHKIEKTKDRVLLKLGFFDEMDCSHVDELVDMRLPGDWIVDDAVVNVAKKIVVVHLALSRNAALRAKKSVSTTSNQTPADGAEIMRMRVTFEVKEEDAPNVHAAVHRILAAFERPADAKLTKVAHRPGANSSRELAQTGPWR